MLFAMKQSGAARLVFFLLLSFFFVNAGEPDPAVQGVVPPEELATLPLPGSAGRVTLGSAWDLTILPESLTTEAVALIGDVVSRSVFSHRVAGITYRSRKEVFHFLIDHPEFAAEVARIFRVGEYRLIRAPEGYWGDDLRGAKGLIRVLHADELRRLYYLEGSYSPKLLPSIKGRLLVLIETRHLDGVDGKSYAETQLTGYLALDQLIPEILATITRPIATAAVERKVKRLFQTIARVSQHAYDDPEGFYETLARHAELPHDMLASFRQILLTHRLPPWAEGKQFRLLPEESVSGSSER
jgi:hypothetical protein